MIRARLRPAGQMALAALALLASADAARAHGRASLAPSAAAIAMAEEAAERPHAAIPAWKPERSEMIRPGRFALAPGGALVFVAALAGAGALAHGGAEGEAKARMEAMKDIAGATRAIGRMLKGATASDAAAVHAQAGGIAGHGGAALVESFPAGIDRPPARPPPRSGASPTASPPSPTVSRPRPRRWPPRRRPPAGPSR